MVAKIKKTETIPRSHNGKEEIVAESVDMRSPSRSIFPWLPI